jgi:hypothetical protein
MYAPIWTAPDCSGVHIIYGIVVYITKMLRHKVGIQNAWEQVRFIYAENAYHLVKFAGI